MTHPTSCGSTSKGGANASGPARPAQRAGIHLARQFINVLARERGESAVWYLETILSETPEGVIKSHLDELYKPKDNASTRD